MVVAKATEDAVSRIMEEALFYDDELVILSLEAFRVGCRRLGFGVVFCYEQFVCFVLLL